LKRVLVVAGAVFALLCAHLLIPNSLTWYQRGIAAIPGLIAIIAVERYLSRRKFDRLPFLEYAVLQFYLFWGLPAVLYDSGEGLPTTPSAMTEAVVAVAITVVLVIASYPLGRKLGRAARVVVSRALPADVPRLGPLYWVWLAGGVAVAAGLTSFLPVEFRFAVGVFAAYYPMLTYTALSALDPSAGRGKKITLLAATGVLAAAGMLTGMMEEAVRPLLVAGVLYLVLLQRVPVKWVVALAVAVVILQPVKGYYRETAWDGDERVATNIDEAAANWAKAFAVYWMTPSSGYSSSSSSLASRFNELSPIARTFELTPARVGFDRGESWKYLAVAALPRVFVYDKATPKEIFNDRFNSMFGLQSRDTIGISTSSYPLVSDGYWNFGWWGVVGVALVLGVLLGFFTDSLPATWAGLTISVALFAELRAHTYVGAHLGGLLQRYVGLGIACWAVILVSRVLSLPRRVVGRPQTRALS
jgi:hypothetical protein